MYAAFRHQSGNAHRKVRRAILGVFIQIVLTKTPTAWASWKKEGDDPRRASPTTGLFACLTLLISRGFNRGCRSNSLPVVRYGNAATQAVRLRRESDPATGRAVRQGVP